MLRIAWFGEKIDQKNILKILPPPRIFRVFFEKNEKCLEFSDLARKLIRKTVRQFPPPDMCAEKFPLVSMGGRAEGLACADPGGRTPIGASGIFLPLQAQSLTKDPPLWGSVPILTIYCVAGNIVTFSELLQSFLLFSASNRHQPIFHPKPARLYEASTVLRFSHHLLG